mgnify:CR=1 FL=1
MGTKFNRASQINVRKNIWRRKFLAAVKNATWDELIPFIITDIKARDQGYRGLIKNDEMSLLVDDYYTDYSEDLLNTNVISHRDLFVKAGILDAIALPIQEDMQTNSLF